MILQIKCKDTLIHRTFFDLLSQKNFFITKNENINIPAILIEDNNEKLLIKINEIQKTYIKPLDLNSIFTNLTKEISKISYTISNFLYFPFQRKIGNEKLKIYLSDIQNKILTNLLINQNGINKDDLYQFIWSNDKTISVNKLETHLTNLKNLLINELNFKISFKSEDKKLKLIID